MRNPSAGRSTCITVSLALASTAGQQRLQLAQPLAARRRRLRAAQDDAQVGLQSPLDGLVQRKADGCAETSPAATLPWKGLAL